MKHKPTILFAILLILPGIVRAQLVLNNGGIVNIQGVSASNSAYLVLNNPPASNPILMTNTVSAQGIMMETEYSITKYNLGMATTAITVPYLSYALEPFPLNVSGISAGTQTASGNLQFSSIKATTRASGWDNATYVPSDVTNGMGGTINPGNTYTADNSANVIDRFWIIDAQGYSTTPGVTYSFGYINAEAAVNGGNSIAIPNLQAMPYDRGATTWGNFGPVGVNNTGTLGGTVSSVSLGAGLIGNVFRSWTLVDHTSPLPIALLNFSGSCLNNKRNIFWQTASESNSAYFTVEKSMDAVHFNVFSEIPASGNSHTVRNYNVWDFIDNETVYYRLSETDLNGNRTYFQVIALSSCKENEQENAQVFSPDNQFVMIHVTSLASQTITITAYDVTGRLILGMVKQAEVGYNEYQIEAGLSQGMYIFELKTNTNTLVKKIIISK